MLVRISKFSSPEPMACRFDKIVDFVCAPVCRCKNGYMGFDSTQEGVFNLARGGHASNSSRACACGRSAVDAGHARPRHFAATREHIQHLQRYARRPLLAFRCGFRLFSTPPCHARPSVRISHRSCPAQNFAARAILSVFVWHPFGLPFHAKF